MSQKLFAAVHCGMQDFVDEGLKLSSQPSVTLTLVPGMQKQGNKLLCKIDANSTSSTAEIYNLHF